MRHLKLFKEQSGLLITDKKDEAQIARDLESKKDVIESKIENPFKSVQNDTFIYLEQIRQLKDYIAKLQSYIDQDVGIFISSLISDITDISSATGAINKYNKEWFDSLLYSEEAKKQVAQSLIIAVNIYNRNINPYWERLINEKSI